MPNTPNVDFNVTNLANQVSTPINGVSFVSGVTVRGPFADPRTIINSWAQFVRIFGGYHPTSLFPLLCKRALDRGAKLRVNRVGHYTDITDSSTLDAAKAVMGKTSLLEFTAAFVTLNEIDLEVNGDAITTVTFATNSNTTMAALAAAIELHPEVAEAYVVDGGAGTDDDRKIIIIPENGYDVAITNIVVTLGASQPTGSETTYNRFLDASGEPLFGFTMKNAGANYNNFVIDVLPASNGDANYFNLSLVNLIEPSLNELYQNIKITGNPTVQDSTYLDDVISQSKTLDVVYEDLSSLSGQLRPINSSIQFIDGSDGTSPAYTDYIGDSNSGVGLNAFDGYDDAYQILIPEADETWTGVHNAGAAYSENRKDLIYWAHLVANQDKTSLITARQALNINSQYTAFFSGGLKVISPQTGAEIQIPEFVDILANAALSDQNFGPWYSFAGLNRGGITNVTGVVKNYGSPALYADLNEIANAQINMSVVKNNAVYLWGAFTGQLANNPEKFLTVVRLLIYLQRSLKPTLERYLEEPNDIPTWKRIFYEVKPFLDGLLTARALSEYQWNGDQDATDLNGSLQVNDPADVQNGKYVINFMIKPITPVQEISVNIIITPAGVSFEAATELL